MNVRFFTGTKEQYLSLGGHSRLALYFCTDTNELYWGDECLSDGVRIVSTYTDLPDVTKAADGIVYYVVETKNGYTLSPDRTSWIQTIYAPVLDIASVPEEEIYSTVTTVGAVRDVANTLRTYVDDEIAEFVTEADLIAKGYLTHDYLFTDTIIFDGGNATE